MKKMKSIFPRILGLTVITGIATLLLSLVFKALLLVSIVGLIIRFGANRFMRKKQMQQHYGMYGNQSFGQLQNGPTSFQGRSPFYQKDVQPTGNFQRSSGIIPIN